MRIIIVFIFAILFQHSTVAQDQELFKYLNSNSRVFTSDSLHVFYFKNWNEDYTSSQIVKFKGESIDPKWGTLIGNYINVEDKAYLIGKIQIDDRYSGFIIRHQSVYSPQKISLLIFDRETKKVSGNQLLADSGGDGTWTYDVDGWLIDIDNDSSLDLVNWRSERWEDDETEEWYRSDSVYVNLWNGQKFKFQRNMKIDTSRFKTYYDQEFNSGN